MKKQTLTFNFLPHPHLRKKGIKNRGILLPFIPITLYYKGAIPIHTEGILDSGADKILIPKFIAENLKLPKKTIKKGYCASGSLQIADTEVGLIIGRGVPKTDLGVIDASYEISGQNFPILIGCSPLFNEYQIIFEEYNNKIILNPREDM